MPFDQLTQVSLLALALNVLCAWVEGAAGGKGVARLCVSRARARAAGDPHREARVTVVTLDATVT